MDEKNIKGRLEMIDLHTHSLISGHAINTIYELTKEAKNKGIKYLGITEHGPSMAGAPHEDYFWISDQLTTLYGVKLLLGIEANILDESGQIDLREDLQEKQKIVSAGLHDKTSYTSIKTSNNTESIVNAMSNPYIKIITHPYRPEFQVDVKQIVKISYETNTLLELNNQLFTRNPNELSDLVVRYKEMISECKKFGIPIILGSDAHVATKIGDFSKILSLQNELGLPNELIINYNLEQFKSYFNV